MSLSQSGLKSILIVDIHHASATKERQCHLEKSITVTFLCYPAVTDSFT